MAWLELADRYGTPDTHQLGVSDLLPMPTWEDHVDAMRKVDRLLSGHPEDELDHSRLG